MGTALAHPIGRNADPTKDQRTQANRAALAYGLRLYYADSLSDTINKSTAHGVMASGLELANRFTSRLEIGNALAELSTERADLAILLKLIYGENRPRRQVAEMLHLSPTTLSEKVDGALNRLVDAIWR